PAMDHPQQDASSEHTRIKETLNHLLTDDVRSRGLRHRKSLPQRSADRPPGHVGPVKHPLGGGRRPAAFSPPSGWSVILSRTPIGWDASIVRTDYTPDERTQT